MALLKGQRFDDYEVLSLLAQGGMGMVYKARQVSLDRLVALKVLSPTLAQDKDFISRFRQEAIAAAKLSHPNLVQVYTAGESNKIPYFSMEYIEGETLQRRLERRGRLELKDALNICLHIAAALDYAWMRAGLIHRDIKPDNVYLSISGDIKLGDMGLAKQSGTKSPKLTDAGIAVGTPYYISPEQACGEKKVDLRSDIYSLGCTLFHMLGGRPPYDAETPMAIMVKHVTEPPPSILDAWSQCPKPVAALLKRMLAKLPKARYQDYPELMADIVRISEKLSLGLTMPESTETATPTELEAVDADANGDESESDIGAGTLPDAGLKKSSLTSYLVIVVTMLVAMVSMLVWLPRRSGQNAADANPPTKTDTTQTVAKITHTPKNLKGPDDFPPPSPSTHDGAKQRERILTKLCELNPGLQKQDIAFELIDDHVSGMEISSPQIKDISPLKELNRLQKLSCTGSPTQPPAPLKDLSPLKGKLLNYLNLASTEVSDLTPLAGMPLDTLNLSSTQTTNLAPLRRMPLTKLFLGSTAITSLAPLASLKKLTDLSLENTTQPLDLAPLAELRLSWLSLKNAQVSNLAALSTLPLSTLDITGMTVDDPSPLGKLRDLDHLYCDECKKKTKVLEQIRLLLSTGWMTKTDGREPKINRKVPYEFSLDLDELFGKEPAVASTGTPAGTDPATVVTPPNTDTNATAVATAPDPIPADKLLETVITKLRQLNPKFDGSCTKKIENGQVTELGLETTDITDISPLGMLSDLRRLSITPPKNSPVQVRGKLADLSPLKGLPLSFLQCKSCQISELSPLQGMPLTYLDCANSNVKDLTPLHEMKLTVLSCSNTEVSDLTPLKGMSLFTLWCDGTKVTDLSPLKDMPLQQLRCPFNKDRDMDVINSLRKLDTINQMKIPAFRTQYGAVVIRSGGH